MPTYKAPPDTEVGSTAAGQQIHIQFSKTGSYSTKDPDEIRVLDDCADAVGHPIEHADRDKE